MPWSRPSVSRDARRVASETQYSAGRAIASGTTSERHNRARANDDADADADGRELIGVARKLTSFPSAFRAHAWVGIVRASASRSGWQAHHERIRSGQSLDLSVQTCPQF